MKGNPKDFKDPQAACQRTGIELVCGKLKLQLKKRQEIRAQSLFSLSLSEQA
jgi:hypothetical protein